MARIISQSLVRHSVLRSSQSIKSSPLITPLSLHRHRSSTPQFIEIDLEDLSLSSSSAPSSSSSDNNGDGEILAVKKLENVVRRLIVQKSTPDWLPFVPGSSFWVPPLRQSGSAKIVDLVDKLANPLTKEEFLSLTTIRGWPSSSFFIEDDPSAQTVEVDKELKPKEDSVEVLIESKSTSETGEGN